MADEIEALTKQQTGFLEIESARDGFGIIVFYWADVASIKFCRANAEHIHYQKAARRIWYETYHVRIAKVERDYRF